MKECPGCHRTLPLSQFNKNKSRPAGINPRCKACERLADRKRRANKKPEVFGDVRTGPKQYTAQTVEAFAAFFKEFSKFELPAHAYAWVESALSNPLLLLNVPPRHAKTTIMSVWFPIWQYACNRDTQIIIASQTSGGAAMKIARKVAYELESNKKLNEAFGRFRPLDSNRPWRVAKGELEVEGKDLSIRTGDLSLQVRGAGQDILGMEADWVIADDMTDRGIAVSEAKRREESDWFLGEVLTRLAPEGRAFCIGQRVHSDDIYGRLADSKDDDGEFTWQEEKHPAISVEGTALWDEQWPVSKLLAKRAAIGESLFNCMYQQQPEISGEFVPKHFIFGDPGCLDYDRVLGQGWKQDTDQLVAVTRVMSVDPSPTKFAAIVVADIIYQPQATEFWCSIVDVRRERMGQRLMLENIMDLREQHKPQTIIFESNSVKWLHEDVLWNRILQLFQTTVDHRTGQNKNDQLMGVWSLASDLEAGRIRFPYGDEDSRTASHHLIDEVLAYPNGRTDDCLMALWFIKYSYRSLIPWGAYSGRFNGSFGKPAWNMEKLGREGAWAGYGR